MAGFDLKEGKYEERQVSEDELWSAFSCVFSSRSREYPKVCVNLQTDVG